MSLEAGLAVGLGREPELESGVLRERLSGSILCRNHVLCRAMDQAVCSEMSCPCTGYPLGRQGCCWWVLQGLVEYIRLLLANHSE